MAPFTGTRIAIAPRDAKRDRGDQIELGHISLMLAIIVNKRKARGAKKRGGGMGGFSTSIWAMDSEKNDLTSRKAQLRNDRRRPISGDLEANQG